MALSERVGASDMEQSVEPIFKWLPRSVSMHLSNDPRFFSSNVLGQRLNAFHTIAIVAVLIVNLSIKEVLLMQKAVRLKQFGFAATINYIGLCIMLAVLVMDIFSVVVLVQQMFHTY